MSSTPSGGRSRAKQAPERSIVILRLPRAKLITFPHDKRSAKASVSKASSTPSTPSAPAKESPTAAASLEVKEETLNGNPDESQANKKGNGTPKPGVKRGGSTVPEPVPKPRARPGPKRRKLGEAGVNGEETGKPWTQSAPTGAHKLGPKANQGAINAGLRALDRSGKPTRKWAKKSFSVKSFTGLVWTLPSWSTPKKEQDPKEESADASTPNANGEQQAPSLNGTIEGDSIQANGTDVNGIASSPAPIAAAP